MNERGIAAGFGLRERLKAADWRLIGERCAGAAIAFTMGRARLFGSFSPFGAAFAAVIPVGLPGELISAAAALGYLTADTPLGALRYMAAILLIRASLNILRGLRRGREPFFNMGVTFAAMGAVGFVYAFAPPVDPVRAAVFAVETFVSAGLVFFYTVALSPWREASDGSYGRLSHTFSLVILAASCLMGLAGVELFGVLSLGRLPAVIIVLLAAYKGGMGVGAAVGTALGAAMDLAAGMPGVFTLAYALSAVLSGVFRRSGRVLFLLSFAAANAISAVWTYGLFPEPDALFECFAGSVIFLLIPDAALARAGAVFPVRSSGFGFIRAREYTRRRLELAGEGLAALSGVVRPPAAEEPGDETAAVFDRAADEVCRSCAHKSRCWQTDSAGTVEAFASLAPRLAREGRVTPEDLPQDFSDACERRLWLISSVNSEARARRLRREHARRVSELSRAAVGQYNDLRELLAAETAWLSGGVTVDTGREKRIAKHLLGLGVDATVAVFRVRGRRTRVEISGEELGWLKQDHNWLARLSDAAGLRLTVAEDEAGRIVLAEAAPMALTAASAGVGRDMADISGDTAEFFTCDEGSYYALISDGMGSGREAREMSSALAAALRNLMEAGTAPELAIRLTENMLAVQNESGLASATVDLMSFDAFSGAAAIYKYGAAPSYLVRDGRARQLSGSRLPAGFLRERPAPVRLRLREGDRLVMLSDGVTGGGDDEWLRELIAGSAEPGALADAVIEEAVKRTGAADDMTVAVIDAVCP